MNHNEARLLIGADPHSVPPELAEHLASCPECSQFRQEMVGLDSNIRRALEQAPAIAAPSASPPAASAPAATVTAITSASTAQRRKPTKHWSAWALAASVGLVSVLAVWALRPTDTLARDVVTHVEFESKSWSSTENPPLAEIDQTLAQAGVALNMSSDKIMYAHSCLFRGHIVPHLVVSTPQGPVTVLILRYENVKHPMNFQEDGMTGVITPAPHGSIAVLMKGNEKVDAVAQQVQQSVRWLP
jgi:Protein of unknown function (DUF3379)